MKIGSIIILSHHLFTSVLGRLSPYLNKDLEESTKNFIRHGAFYTFAGLVQQSKIVGTAVSEKDRYPYQVALMKDDEQFCTGSLIGSRWVLTAAHCFGYVTHAHIGRYDLDDDSETYENIEVIEEIPHPQFNFEDLDYDFMLLKLKNPSKQTTVMLDDGSTLLSDGMNLSVMGWGKSNTIETNSDILVENDVNYYSRDKCSQRYGFLDDIDVTLRMFCAVRSGDDSCQGNSGAPIIKKGGDGSDDVQIGLVSWGVGCLSRLRPGVHSQVSEVLDFIEYYVRDRKRKRRVWKIAKKENSFLRTASRIHKPTEATLSC